MLTEALNGLKKGDVVEHSKCHRSQWKHLNHGIIDDISQSGKSVYVDWYDENGKKFHWAKYNAQLIIKRGLKS
ncbi:hypothetical protein [Brevibacillus sp. 179-C9.3 HS]|uniref:hypothetical protein n=1 Tax=unclassified Brevibacillus TaxID=2684853 RepID=UPI0039A0BD86